jgi:hypothetical protein
MQWFPGYFCGSNDLSAPNWNNYVNGVVKSACTPNAIAAYNKKNANAPYKDQKACQDAQTQKLQNQQKQGFGGNGSKRDLNAEQPKMVYPAAYAGSDYFTVWSLVFGDYQSHAGAGTAVGAWGRAHAADASTGMDTAKAEFFYDTGAEDDSKGGTLAAWVGYTLLPDWFGYTNMTSGFPPDAMYNMRWRARLRRDRLPLPNVFSVITGQLSWGLKEATKTEPPPLLGNSRGWYHAYSMTGLLAGVQGWIKGQGYSADQYFKSIGLVRDYTTLDGHLVH